jgi:hypothetical protein
MIRTLLLLCALALALSACKRRQPSPAFDEASRQFSKLYAEKLDDAFVDSQMAQIQSQLKTVPEDSLDAQGAQDLLKRIDEGTRRMKAQEDARAKSLAEAAAKAASAPTGVTFQDSAPEKSAPAPGAVDAGAPQHPIAGMSLEDFNRLFSDCFRAGTPVQVNNDAMRDTYVLQDYNYCKAQHPGFDEQLVVSDGTKIMAVVKRSLVSVSDAGAASPPGAR